MTLSSKLSGTWPGDFLPSNPSCHYYDSHRGNESFDTHIWMLKTFLGRSRSSDGLKTLQLYSIAASFRKMLSRMENRRIAKTYLNCLTNLKSRTFELIELPHIETTRSSDRHPDQTFLDHLPSLAVFMDLPNLTAAKAMGKSCEIYNKKTCIEFHKLLCELLIHFHKSLTALRALKETMVNVREEIVCFSGEIAHCSGE